MGIDPDGRIVWFIPVIIGAAIGGTLGGIHAHNSGDYSIAGGIWRGALIGAAAGAGGAGVSALGGGAMLAGAAGGAVAGSGFSGLQNDWNGKAMLRGGLIGTASGFIGGGVASAIGGGFGSFMGGVASDVTSQLFSTGNIDILQAGIAGAMSFGIYHGVSFASFKWGGGDMLGVHRITYRQYNKINAVHQRARFWKREHGLYLNRDGSARLVPRNNRHKFSVTFDDWRGGDFGTVHAHWAKPDVDWVNVGGTGTRFERFNARKSYPAGSQTFSTVGSSHSPGDLKLPGLSAVIGRTGSSFFYGVGQPTQIRPDRFLRWFIFPWLGN